MKYSVEQIENIIYPYMPDSMGEQKNVIEAMNYAFMAGGKRLRPMLVRLAYDLFAEETIGFSIGDDGLFGGTAVDCFMAAIEMIHSYSLIHDDLPALDNDDLRRGKPTVHVKFGEPMGILAGDGLLNYAYETAAKAFRISPGDIRIEKAFMILTRKPGITGMIGGQTLDVLKTGQPLTEDEMLYIYENKTAALIECALMCGATLAGAGNIVVDALEQAGKNIGLAFQITDDILDVTGDERIIGKPLHSDEKNNKTTYVTLHGIEAAKKAADDHLKLAESIVAGLSVKDEDARADLIEIIKKLGQRDK